MSGFDIGWFWVGWGWVVCYIEDIEIMLLGVGVIWKWWSFKVYCVIVWFGLCVMVIGICCYDEDYLM